ncbi:hypothetical protein BAE44_0021937 [Dichanthelium oligosanthes]|uniref:Iron-related transcription factor 3 bHLH domain-containing protein n=1 Tax=Dichanthelium oligosanthes TaxID=888268 RepID=A0A1E5UW03_9POAL|nr:hypothetical protein BAE44_0021937 [Dichanthelium oligosanthes]
MVPSERGSVATAVSTPAADKLLHGPIAGKKCKKAAPRKVHKAEREKHKRDHLNDLFIELGNMLVESLRKEHSNLQNESHYVAIERNELQDENGMLRKEISELQDDLRMRTSSNPAGWGHGTAGLSPPVPHPTSAVFSSQQAMQPPTIASTVFPLHQALAPSAVIEQSYATPPPLELRLFPGAASVEVHEPSEGQDAPNHVARPQASYESGMINVSIQLIAKLGQ